ncbi:hypothetical protein [Pseudomonas guariconensis]|uniref:hypothetical protein n=1 Tax=Pseudomonas guariconensis TaxID=1288410 RepID=UPI002B058DE6|nr:hypothetical protein [Pseudomonas guariconensis]
MNRASIMALLDTVLLRSWRMGIDPITASTALTADQMGHVVVDSTAGDLAVTLPGSSAALRGLEVTLRRKDVTTNVLSILAAGADKIVLPGAASGIAATELIFQGDYLTLRADGGGKWWCVGQAQLPPSLTSLITKFSVAGVYSYNVPSVFRSGRLYASVEVVGGGGGGGRFINGGGGGGGGGKAKSCMSLAGVTNVVVTVGSGGAGRTGSDGDGVTGGSTSFGGYLSATGGMGGSKWFGGRGGVGVGGDINLSLGAGANMTRHDNSVTGSSYGGGSGGGGGGSGNGSGTVGSSGGDAVLLGTGGGGGNENGNGGRGMPGEVIIQCQC